MSDTCSGCRFYECRVAGSSPVSYFHYCYADPEPVLRESQRPMDCRDYQRPRPPSACSRYDERREP